MTVLDVITVTLDDDMTYAEKCFLAIEREEAASA